MKLALILLVCTCGVFCAPEKRVFLGSLSTFDTYHLKQTVQTLLNTIGAYAPEPLCEKECRTLLTDPTHFLHYSCPLICHGLPALVPKYNLPPQTTTVG